MKVSENTDVRFTILNNTVVQAVSS